MKQRRLKYKTLNFESVLHMNLNSPNVHNFVRIIVVYD